VAAVAVVLVLLLTGGDGGDSDESRGAEVFPAGGSVVEASVTDLREAAEAAGCELYDTPTRGEPDRTHADVGTDLDYRSNPPTLGRHWPPGYQAEDGLYMRAPADEALVHSMEHGRVVFWVEPTLPVEARQTVRALFDSDDYQLLVVPRRNMPHAVAATAWNADPEPGGTGRTLACPRWDPGVTDALRAFADEHRSQGPEPIP
jgi:hypothetical protein